MSININDIYCNHYLKTSELVDYCKSPNYKSFKYPEFPLLTSFHVKDTIHYNALVNNYYKIYDTYIKDTEQKEHSLSSFHNLRDNFTINKIKKIKVKYNFEKNKYFVTDGVHRLCIMVYKGIIKNKVPVQYLDITNNNNFYFVIYDHAIDKQNEICDIIIQNDIRIDKKMEIKIPNNKFNEFIFDIYPDKNKKHILAKNNFIIEQCKNKNFVRAVIIIVSLNKWEKFKDKCKEIELTKIKIRNKYNPKFQDINKRIGSLNRGVSHNHVIHSIDFPSEFMMIYNVIEKYNKYIKNL